MRALIGPMTGIALAAGIAGLIPSPIQAQVTRGDVQALIDSALGDRQLFSVGLSMGARFLTVKRENMLDATISPVDGTVQLDTLQRRDIIISAAIVFSPFRQSTRPVVRGLGFIANLDLAQIGGDGALSRVNQSVEGGLGFVYLFHPGFGVALTYDRAVKRRPRSYVVGLAGQQVVVDGEPLTNLDRANDSLFIDRSMDGISFKIFFRIS